MANSPSITRFSHQQTLPIHERLATPYEDATSTITSPDGKKIFYVDNGVDYIKNVETGEQFKIEGSSDFGISSRQSLFPQNPNIYTWLM